MLSDFASLFIPLVAALAIHQLWKTSPQRQAHFAFWLFLIALPLPSFEAPSGKWFPGWRLFLVGFLSQPLGLPPLADH